MDFEEYVGGSLRELAQIVFDMEQRFNSTFELLNERLSRLETEVFGVSYAEAGQALDQLTGGRSTNMRTFVEIPETVIDGILRVFDDFSWVLDQYAASSDEEARRWIEMKRRHMNGIRELLERRCRKA